MWEGTLSIINLHSSSLVDLPLEEIKPYEFNAREHPARQLEMLEASVRRTRHISPILVNAKKEIIAGHARFVVAKRLLLSTIPAFVIAHLSDAEERALRIADNAIAAKGGWTGELLAKEIEIISTLDVNFDPIELGFETAEIDQLILGARSEEVREEEPPPPDRTRPAISRPGDVFHIGRHVVVGGDSRHRETYELALEGRPVNAVISDQPWNLPARFISGKGKITHPDFVMASGEMSPEGFAQFTDEVLQCQASVCAPGALVFQFIDWRSVELMMRIGRDRIGELVGLCVWVKQQPRMGSPYRSQHELACVFRVPGGKSKDNVRLGKYGRNRSNVWAYPAPSAFGSERDKLALHPTCKNQRMIADAILDCTDRNDVVLDAFLGSGTTILAAHETGRMGVGIELDCHYLDLAIRRISKLTGETPIHANGMTFDELEEARAIGETK
jgi:DNA modification methylase